MAKSRDIHVINDDVMSLSDVSEQKRLKKSVDSKGIQISDIKLLDHKLPDVVEIKQTRPHDHKSPHD